MALEHVSILIPGYCKGKNLASLAELSPSAKIDDVVTKYVLECLKDLQHLQPKQEKPSIYTVFFSNGTRFSHWKKIACTSIVATTAAYYWREWLWNVLRDNFHVQVAAVALVAGGVMFPKACKVMFDKLTQTGGIVQQLVQEKVKPTITNAYVPPDPVKNPQKAQENVKTLELAIINELTNVYGEVAKTLLESTKQPILPLHQKIDKNLATIQALFNKHLPFPPSTNTLILRELVSVITMLKEQQIPPSKT